MMSLVQAGDFTCAQRTLSSVSSTLHVHRVAPADQESVTTAKSKHDAIRNMFRAQSTPMDDAVGELGRPTGSGEMDTDVWQ